MSSAKPMSSISSASSKMMVSNDAGLERAAPDVVQRAAGRGDDDVDAALQRLELADDRRAAVDRQRPDPEAAAVAVDGLGDLRRQLARRDQDQRARRRAGLAPRPRRCSSGSANAAVLPVPVAAWPSRSRPSISGGIASRWIGVGSS